MKLLNERGFMLLNVVILTLITSFAAMILLNAAPRVRTPQSVLRLTALHLANEQFAMMESKAATVGLEAGSYSFMGNHSDLTTLNAGAPITFEVDTQVTTNDNLCGVKVIVSWEVNGKTFELETERTIRVAEGS